MLDRLRDQLRRAKWHASDIAWNQAWRAARVAATPWVRKHYDAARAKLGPPVDAVLDDRGLPPGGSTAEGRRGVDDRGLPPGGSTAEGRRGVDDRGLPPGGSAAEGRRGVDDRSLPPGGSTAEGRRGVIDRARLDGWLRDAAPPGVPFDAVVLRGDDLRARFGEGPLDRRSLHMHGKVRMTHRGIPSPAVIVLALFSDVAADYFVETMAADVAARACEAYGDGVAIADTQASVPVLLKEVATAAGLGTIGKNALFFSRRFGFNCKLNAIFLNAPVDHPDPAPVGDGWKLPDCSTCNLCVEACPVGAFDDYAITRTESCDRLIAGDFFGPRRDHMCRACITRCPVSNDVLKLRRSEGVPKRMFWDNEAQMSLVADLFMYRPSFFVWLIQRFYYGSELPGRDVDKKKGYTDSLTAAMTTTTSDRTRDGWRLATKRPR